MSEKLCFDELSPDAQRMQMTTFVRRFTPQSWWPWLTPSKIQLWASLLLRSAWGNVAPGLAMALGISGEPNGGVGTWFRNAEGVWFVCARAGKAWAWNMPEWGLGVWSEVTSAFQRFCAPHADWSDEWERSDMDYLGEYLLKESRGHRVFEALGILGGIWSPAGGMSPDEKTLDNPD